MCHFWFSFLESLNSPGGVFAQLGLSNAAVALAQMGLDQTLGATMVLSSIYLVRPISTDTRTAADSIPSFAGCRRAHRRWPSMRWPPNLTHPDSTFDWPQVNPFFDEALKLRPFSIGSAFATGRAKLRAEFAGTMLMNWRIWPAANFVNFLFVPPALRLLYERASPPPRRLTARRSPLAARPLHEHPPRLLTTADAPLHLRYANVISIFWNAFLAGRIYRDSEK